MTESILQTLAVNPSDEEQPPLTLEELGRYLDTHCNTQEERDRNGRHVLRDELYRDGGVKFMESVIDDVFDDPDVRAKRKKWVKHARFSNPLKRVVNELSTVYSEPAKRTVEPEENDAKYQAVLTAARVDEQMLQGSRMLNLHRALLVRFRVRKRPGAAVREPVIDWATPSSVRAVLHPNDPTLVVGWLIKTSYRSARGTVLDTPSWTLWTDHERIHLRDNMQPIAGTHLVHELGCNPWVAVSLSPPGPGFWPGEEGEDLVAAAVMMWLQSVLMLKESKSATMQPIITGDGAMTGRGQAADSEVPIELSDGQSVTTVDMSMDLSMFRDTADHILEHVAQNYGMSAALVKQEGVQSADARELMRVPLKELRKHQQVPLRRMEHELVLAMVAVLTVDEPSMLFSADGWRVLFGEALTPLSRNEETDLAIKERTAGLDNTVAIIMRRNPGMDEARAVAEMEHNITVETARNVLMRPLMANSGAAMGGTPDDESKAPKLDDNGNPIEPDDEEKPADPDKPDG